MTVWRQNWKQGLAAITVSKEMTFPQLYALDTPSVSTLNFGQKTTDNGVAVFAALIFKIQQFFGAKWETEQIADCAKVCFDEWHYLTFAELAHFAQKAKSGGFKEDGKALMYGQFVPATLIDWFCTYSADNLAERGRFFGAKKTEFTEPENPVDPEVIESAIIELKLGMAADEMDVAESRREIRKQIDESYVRFNKLIADSDSQKEAEKLVKNSHP